MRFPSLPTAFDDVRSVSPLGPSIGFRDLSRRRQRAGIETRAGVFGRLQDFDPILAPQPQTQLTPRGLRFPLDLPATLSAREGKAWLRTVDISAGGIKLRGAIPVAVGSRGIIRLAGLVLDMAGHVRWRAGNLSGFQFEKPISHCDLFRLFTH